MNASVALGDEDPDRHVRLPLGEIAKAEPAVAGNLTAEEIDRALNPAQYLGSAESMIGAAIMGAQREMEKS